MKERPILFSAEMVRAILDGRKTQTRRVIKPQPIDGLTYDWVSSGRGVGLSPHDHESPYIWCPYGQPGDRLWVRETWTAIDDYCGVGNRSTAAQIRYRADSANSWRDIPEPTQEEWFFKLTRLVNNPDRPWRPSIFMPRWASRITLKVTSVRVERVQKITKKDAIAEGVQWSEAFPEGYTINASRDPSGMTVGGNYGVQAYDATVTFSILWDRLNAKRGYGWDANPWVWVIEFRSVIHQ